MDDLVRRLKGELDKIPKSVLEKINNFAVENNKRENPKIQAAYFHPDPESGEGTIYLITEPHEYSDELEDKVISLSLDVLKRDNLDVNIMEWPVGYDGIEDYGFFKELCIFDYMEAKAA